MLQISLGAIRSYLAELVWVRHLFWWGSPDFVQELKGVKPREKRKVEEEKQKEKQQDEESEESPSSEEDPSEEEK